MDIILLYASVVISGIIVGRKARSTYQILLVVTSMTFVLLLTSLSIYYHFVYLNELLIMFCLFILLFMLLIYYGKECLIPQSEIVNQMFIMIYNMLIVYVLTMGGLLIAFRFMILMIV